MKCIARCCLLSILFTISSWILRQYSYLLYWTNNCIFQNNILGFFCFALPNVLPTLFPGQVAPTMPSSKLESFDRVDFDFKTVHGHALKTSILVPKNLQSKPRETYPTVVNWHGGGFVVGERLYEGWLPVWCVPVCVLVLSWSSFRAPFQAPFNLCLFFRLWLGPQPIMKLQTLIIERIVKGFSTFVSRTLLSS